MVAIIDYDAGNIKSVEKALLHLGEEVIITRDREQILNSDLRSSREKDSIFGDLSWVAASF